MPACHHCGAVVQCNIWLLCLAYRHVFALAMRLLAWDNLQQTACEHHCSRIHGIDKLANLLSYAPTQELLMRQHRVPGSKTKHRVT